MKISLNWLKDYVALEASVEEICRAVTFLGFEVEQVIRSGAPKLDQVVVGEVLTRDRHPNADKLSVCTVDLGSAGGVKTIVCGAQNYKVGDRVPVALPGAVLPGNFVIKQSKIRGQLSDGMMCSGKELGIIPTPRRAITLAFAGPDKHTLYIGAMGAVGPDGKDWQTPKDVRNVAMTIYRVKMLAAGPANKPK